MKTLVVLFVILFCMAFGNANAQSESTKESWPVNLGYECDGVWDLLTGSANYHSVTKIDKDGNVSWMKMQIHSIELVSASTGEEFRWNYVQKQDAWGMPGSVMEQHYNLIGNMGTHVLFSVVYDIYNWTWPPTALELKAKCL